MRRREFITLLSTAAAAWPLQLRATAAADFIVDGVPLPSDVSLASIPQSATDLQQRWSGVWVGAWNDALKHILLVERIDADGSAGIVYAEADNLHTGIRARWWRLAAVVSGRTLAVTGPSFTATYDMDDDEGLNGVFRSGDRMARAAMSRTDLAALTLASMMDSGSGIVWFRGKSEMLQTDLIEDDRPIRLETIIFKPSGRGPFPLAVFNHGSTGKYATPGLVKESWVSLEVADFLNKRGWLVAFPQRRGRGKSDGVYNEGECSADALSGADRALADIGAAIAVLRQRKDIDPGPLLIGGQSRGGALSVAYAGAHPEKTLGAINFVGGWLSESCAVAELVNQTLFARGAPFDRSTIWLYGQDDHFYSIAHSKSNFAAFEKAGGRGKFFEFDTPSDIGHNVIHYPDLWGGPIGDYLNSLAGKR